MRGSRSSHFTQTQGHLLMFRVYVHAQSLRPLQLELPGEPSQHGYRLEHLQIKGDTRTLLAYNLVLKIKAEDFQTLVCSQNISFLK